MNENDGIPFFLKLAFIQNKLKDNDDIEGLKTFTKKWKEKINKSNEPF